MAHYSGGSPKCACCGESMFEFLSIDHIGGGGKAHRKKIGGSSYLYSWLERNGFPEGFQVLCHNCNQAIGIFGYCPHKLTPAERRRNLPDLNDKVEDTRQVLLKTAKMLMRKHVYPGLHSLANITGLSPTWVSRLRRDLVERNVWPTEILKRRLWTFRP